MACQWGKHAPNLPIQIPENVPVVHVVHPHKQVLMSGLFEMETRELNATYIEILRFLGLLCEGGGPNFYLHFLLSLPQCQPEGSAEKAAYLKLLPQYQPEGSAEKDAYLKLLPQCKPKGRAERETHF